MDSLLYLAIGVLLGLAVGYGLAAAKKTKASNAEVELAASRATADGLAAQDRKSVV